MPVARGRGMVSGLLSPLIGLALPAARPIASGLSVERPYGWVVAWVSMAMMAVGAGAPYLVVVALKPIAAEFGWPRAILSGALSLTVLSMGVLATLGGRTPTEALAADR